MALAENNLPPLLPRAVRIIDFLYIQEFIRIIQAHCFTKLNISITSCIRNSKICLASSYTSGTNIFDKLAYALYLIFSL